MGILSDAGLPEDPGRTLTDEEITRVLKTHYKKYPESRKARAAMQLAYGNKTCREIAASVFITERQLMRWKKEPEFMREVRKYKMHHDIRLGILPDKETLDELGE